MFRRARMFLRDRSGATAIEYGIIAAILGIGVAAGAGGLGQVALSMYTFIVDNYSAATSATP